MNTPRIAFIGAGNMASSLIGGLLKKGHPADQIIASDPYPEALQKLADRFAVGIAATNNDAVAGADVVLLAVKPQVMAEVCQALAPSLSMRKPLVISIAAGITLGSLEQWLGKELPITRCMPNTPALIQRGISGLYSNSKCSLTHNALSELILSAVGECLWLPSEHELHAVTAVSGSGPAYFFLVMEAMIEAGVALGLDHETASKLTLQTALGAAHMASEMDASPAELRRQVTSPGGTTEQAIAAFEQSDLRGIFRHALQAAANRSVTLASELGGGASTCK